MGVLVG